MGLFSKKPTPEEFYAVCVKSIHDLGMKHGFVKGGVKLIPELLLYSGKLLNSDLNCPEVTSQYPDTVDLLQALSNRCLMYGIILADTWHREFSNLASMAEIIESDGPNGYIQPLVEDELGFTPQLFAQWMEAVFVTAMKDFGSVNSSETQYMLKIPMASYQLGVSMMLSHYGL